MQELFCSIWKRDAMGYAAYVAVILCPTTRASPWRTAPAGARSRMCRSSYQHVRFQIFGYACSFVSQTLDMRECYLQRGLEIVLSLNELLLDPRHRIYLCFVTVFFPNSVADATVTVFEPHTYPSTRGWEIFIDEIFKVEVIHDMLLSVFNHT